MNMYITSRNIDYIKKAFSKNEWYAVICRDGKYYQWEVKMLSYDIHTDADNSNYVYNVKVDFMREGVKPTFVEPSYINYALEIATDDKHPYPVKMSKLGSIQTDNMNSDFWFKNVELVNYKNYASDMNKQKMIVEQDAKCNEYFNEISGFDEDVQNRFIDKLKFLVDDKLKF